MNPFRSLRACACTFALWLPALVAAQESDVAIWIPPEAGAQPIVLERVALDIRSDGFVARTSIDLTFHNPNPRVLEGEFVFPLGAGQQVSGYALEVDGRLREGVVVPKQTARVAFEDTIRQQIDPGLAELTRGNVFRTRLYPLPAQGRKRVVLRFEQVLRDDGTHWRYVLPLAFRQPVASFEVEVEALRAGGAPRDAGATADATLAFDAVGEAWRASLRRAHVRPQRELAFSIPKAAGDAAVLEAADALEPAWRSVVAQLDSGAGDARGVALRPKTIALWVDASGSARERDRARERALLARWFTALGDVDVQLVPFRDAADAVQRFRVRRGDARELLAAFDALPLDGGSSYAAIDPARTPGVDLVLLLGDGLSNFGGHEPAWPASAPPLKVLHAAQRADHARLARIARRAGGDVVDLLQLDADTALAALQRLPWQLRAVRAEGGECTDVTPRAGTAVAARTVVAARCRGRGTLTLEFGAGAKRTTRTLAFGDRTPAVEPLAASVHRLWAGAEHVAREAEPGVERAALVALATRHGLVTADTSLLVLDRIEDYVRWRVLPPEPELRARYQALLAQQPKAADDGEAAARAARVDALRQQWREFSGWHTQRHPWLETLLAPAAGEEAAAWLRLSRVNPAARARQAEAAALEKRVTALVSRWSRDGADASTRAPWEREATAAMLALDALRRERLEGHPDDAAWVEDAAPQELARAEAAADGESLDSISVTGSRVAESVATDEASPAVLDDPSPMSVAAPPPSPAGAAAAAGKDDGTLAAAAATPPPATITLAGWNPDAPYLAPIRAAQDPYAAYLAAREANGDAPAFYLDVADLFRDTLKQPALAQRILSNLAELALEETTLVRVLGHRLLQWDAVALAAGQFEEARTQRPEEPQSHRDLALALARLPQPDAARAATLLWQVASGEWHGRFVGVELIALHELNALHALHPAAVAQALRDVPPELLAPLPVGLRVVLSWDADNTDIDLWVIDPLGQRVYYGENRSPSGGHVSNDQTQGYGPEVFTIARPLPGTYRVQTHYFGDRRQSLTGPVTVQVEFQSGFGRADGRRVATTRRLADGDQELEVGRFTVQ